jgi:hypothetical protein
MKNQVLRSSVALIGAAAIGIVLAASVWVVAQRGGATSSRTAANRPDLSGFWGQSAADQATADEAGNVTREFPSRRCGPYQVHCDVRTNQSADGQLTGRFDPNRALYKPEYWDRIQQLDLHANTDDPMMRCQPHGVPRVGPPTKIIQTADEIVFFYAATAAGTQPHDFRIIPIDGRKHAPDEAKDWTYYGRSVGSWDGDTLVIDSVGFNDITWLRSAGYLHSDQLHVIERLRRDGNTLHYQVTVDDPVMLLQPWTMPERTLRLNADPKAYIPEGSPCNDIDVQNITTTLRH